VRPPCLSPLTLPLGAPARPPCQWQTNRPGTGACRQRRPACFDIAVHRGPVHIARMPGGHVGLRFVMGLTVSFDPNTTKRRFAGETGVHGTVPPAGLGYQRKLAAARHFPKRCAGCAAKFPYRRLLCVCARASCENTQKVCRNIPYKTVDNGNTGTPGTPPIWIPIPHMLASF
jgi:hypothetical protein